ncbi:oligosaccharide flippase family protein [Cohnella faecalis]|uniref:Uncharacterized protein n=1 Tax=Cohnella faecalis TaxID=2315694 RepID=A0A398CNK7_9BACL|nr:oligosaccharide flippase family protein [Cohnella faecalis]RIE03820.1 hypothetical protein D3H35_09715 [Cohnella faecalis]
MKIHSKMIGPAMLIGAQYSTQIIAPLVSLLVVRYLGSEQFGLYASAMAITALLSVMPDFGLQQAALNMSARKEWTIQAILRKSLTVGLQYSLITFLLTVVWLYAIDYEMTTRLLGLMLGLTFFRISIVTVLTTGLQIQGKYGTIAVWNVAVGASQWISTLAAILAGASLYWLVLGPIVVSLVLACLMLVAVGRKLGLFPGANGGADRSLIPVKQLLNGSWNYGLAASMHQLYYKSDVAILSATRQPVEVGQYTVAFRIIELFFLFPGVVFNQVLYPKYCIWCRENIPKLRLYYGIMNKVMVAAGLLAAMILVLFGKEIVGLLFGESQLEAAGFLLILALAIPLRFWVSSAGAVLTNDGLIKTKLKIQCGIAVLNVGLNVLFIPRFGGEAAAINMIVTHIVLLAAYTYAAHRYLLGFARLRTFDWALPAALTAASLLGLFILYRDNLPVRIAGGGLLVAAVAVAFVFWFRRYERNEIRQLFSRGEKQAARLGL